MTFALIWLTVFCCSYVFLSFVRLGARFWEAMEPALVWATVLTFIWYCLSDFPVVEP